MPRTHRNFPGRYPLSNRYFVNRSRWLLSKLAKAWITRINRKDELPKSVFVCEDHFESTDFDANNEIKIRYREQGIKIMFYFLVFNSAILHYHYSSALSADESFPSTSHWLTPSAPRLSICL